MNELFGPFSIIVLIVVLVALVRNYFYKTQGTGDEKVRSAAPDKYLPYKTKKTLMTPSERMLFESLRGVLGTKYDIYPQMKLDKIFDIEYQRFYKYYLGYLRKINQKSVDYLVVNRQTQSPIFAIELDDFSHESEDRRDRDDFVEELFNKANLPLVRFSPGNYKIEEVKKVFEKYLV